MYILYGPDAHWKSNQQKRLIEEALNIQDDNGLLSIVPTGFGKSLLFLIPAIMAANTNKVIVVFLPLKALITTIAQQIRSKNIHCTVWNEESTRNPTVCNILLISTDYIATSLTLNIFLSRLESENRLDRFIIDECHMLLSAEYRAHRLQKIRNIRMRKAPVILITATLPPSIEKNLLSLMVLNPQKTTILRLASARPNIRYMLSRPKNLFEAKTVLYGSDLPYGENGLFKQWTEELGNLYKGIIFTTTVKEAESLGDELQIPVYHAKLKEKESNLSSWISGSSKWIVGTICLGAGIDIPNILIVVNWGIPTDILDFAQMSGRGGRGIPFSKSILIEPLQTAQSSKFLWENARIQHEDRFSIMQQVLTAKECIRSLMGIFLDGEELGALSCNLIKDAQLCWNCTRDISKVILLN